MPSVFLSHSSGDKPFVRELADFLEREAPIKVWLDELRIAPGANIVSEIAEGLDSDFILLILSPDSVESAWVKEEWTDAFWEQTNTRRTKLAGVLYRDCQIPRLLRNKKYFDLRTNHPEGFREIRTWLLTEKPAQRPARTCCLLARPFSLTGTGIIQSSGAAETAGCRGSALWHARTWQDHASAGIRAPPLYRL